MRSTRDSRLSNLILPLSSCERLEKIASPTAPVFFEGPRTCQNCFDRANLVALRDTHEASFQFAGSEPMVLISSLTMLSSKRSGASTQTRYACECADSMFGTASGLAKRWPPMDSGTRQGSKENTVLRTVRRGCHFV